MTACNRHELMSRAETLAGTMSLRTLTPEESEQGVDLIFALLAREAELQAALERIAEKEL